MRLDTVVQAGRRGGGTKSLSNMSLFYEAICFGVTAVIRPTVYHCSHNITANYLTTNRLVRQLGIGEMMRTI